MICQHLGWYLCSLQAFDLMLNEAIGPGKVWGRGDVVDILSLQELDKFLTHEERAIICVDEAGQSILGDEFL